ncbi:uncharacterized protein SPAPADRAFT_143265 [Spathaspora passalidarum NRRL Y-27907]|uniref:Lariat debranching enzyme C-terminal domain-containing protein n=1 Tax=Spathaspora passalidarum (strain NRRL Y-27907 / 11-Y1) TaxID=619300 RepID=G3AU59_SPAPN|nr:uncharacterized protein SPAPADRAFT_143265 [Spathaspora passalidarum NRRL Y-27907]EGW30435.1 hypothetical protein SPAPADRAFT_143265 [Spathaspora passalidarum NRRL Y-27907]
MSSVRIAIQGCAHGELEQIYAKIDPKTDLLLILGDFQALRSTQDYQALNVPAKYRALGDFHSYYSGALTAPCLTIFIGGNHENSAYLQELKYGGWVAPRMYYLGEFGSVWYRGIQIAGWSGIFNRSTFLRNNMYVEKPPYRRDELVSVYHQKLTAFIKLYMMNHDLDVVMSHDWPVGIEDYGDKRKLLALKPFFKKDIENKELGSPLNKFLLHHLRPRYWFSAHLHVLFEASVSYKGEVNSKEQSKSSNNDEIALNMDDETEKEISNKDKINLDMDEEDLYLSNPQPKKTPPRMSPSDHSTNFLALDKCGKRRIHLRHITITPDEAHQSHPSYKDNKLYYSRRAIAINKVLETYLKSHEDEFRGINTRKILEDPHNLVLVNELMPLVELELRKLSGMKDELFIVPESFKVVAPTEDDGSQLKFYPNNQTEEYCKKFDVVSPDLA